MSDRVIPHDLAAENFVLGAILANNEAFNQAAEIIGAQDFFRDANRRIFDKMVGLTDRGEPVDLITLKDELHKSGDLDEVGGPAYIAALVDCMPRGATIEPSARIIKEKSDLRRAIAAANLALRRAYDGDLDSSLDAMRAAAEQCDAANSERGLPESDLSDAVDVAAEGRQIETDGIPELVEGMIPNLGMLGFNVAYAKTGKTTFSHALGAAVAAGQPFLGRNVKQVRVLHIAAEDPPEYTAWVARNNQVAPGQMTFYRRPIVFDRRGLARIIATVGEGGYGLVQVASWQSVVRGLVRDENDNAGAVAIVEDTKAAARQTGIPWLIDAHSGKAEDQADDADPSRAMRGASAAAGAADFTLLLRYADGTFGSRRRLSGKGRFVSFEPVLMDFDASTSTYTVVEEADKTATAESTWGVIAETGAITPEARSGSEIFRAAGLLEPGARMTGAQWRQLSAALKGRADVGRVEEIRRGQKTTCYRLLEGR